MPLPDDSHPGPAKKVTLTLGVDELPTVILAKLGTRPPPGTRYVVTAEVVEDTDAERIAALRADIAAGIAEADAGRVIDGEDLFRELEARFGSAA